MGEIPSLLSLCANTIRTEIIYGDRYLQNIFELPSDLVDYLMMQLPAVALQKLHEALSFKHYDRSEFVTDSVKDSKKRGRCADFNTAWKKLVMSRWPEGIEIEPFNCMTKQDGVERYELTFNSGDWQQIYWEAHLQNCLDEAAETALLPSFDGCIGEITMSDTIVKSIGYIGTMHHTIGHYSKLSSHCQQFGCYARFLRLQNVTCVTEICELLSNSKLQGLVFRRVNSKSHVDGACKLLKQNSETLLCLEFIHCRMSPTSWVDICDSLYTKGIPRHGIRYLSIKSSSILGSNPASIPIGLLSFLSSGRSLCSLNFCDNRLDPGFAKMIFDTLIDSSSNLSNLEISDSNIAGWLSKAHWRFSSCSKSNLGTDKSLKSLHVLNLRGNNLCEDDAEDLTCALIHMPNLQSLDISDNPIGDDGIRSLIPYFIEASDRASPLVDIKIENCNLSCIGVIQLLKSLSTLRKSLNTLSIADNDLGSHVAVPLADFLATSHVRVLNIEDIGLGPSGFLELEKEISGHIDLVSINQKSWWH
ncbi:RNI-like superfamily protein isoform X2 [Tasmannia lanceolata]|uniref:RNI-like superfamily protein isoform X2 n=1 Tax=Tasmannia lanceolata TaxID=3420 RepID=UPI004063B79F